MSFRIDDGEWSDSHSMDPEWTTLPSSPGVSLKAAPDELVLGQLRDWNEELQAAREMPAEPAQLKFFRDRTIFKVPLPIVDHMRVM